MSWPAALGSTGISPEEERLRPLYARVLRLQHLDPGGMLCFCFLEGTLALGLLLALAELVSWWGVLLLPLSVAVMVKVNDLVAAAVIRSAARVPAVEQERFRREIQPAVGRAAVPVTSLSGPVGPNRPIDMESGGPATAGPPRDGGKFRLGTAALVPLRPALRVQLDADSTGATEPMLSRPVGAERTGRRKRRSTGGWLSASLPVRQKWLDLAERCVRRSTRRHFD